MKTFLTVMAFVAATAFSFGQGKVNFGNTSTILISAGGVAMPGRDTSAFNFAVFLAPSTTQFGSAPAPLFSDPAWQFVGGYNVNHDTAVGRLVNSNNMVLNGYAVGQTVDFIVRGWSANAGQTWEQALAFWNNGAPPASMYIGSSSIGDNLRLGDGAVIPAITLFGSGLNFQVGGFNMTSYGYIFPEPASATYLIIGAIVFQYGRRRRAS